MTMKPAEQRIDELIARWLASIDLHLRYADLDDEQYWQVQTWPRHERPSRWILEIAKQKVLELQAQCEKRRVRGDADFAEALELMAFLSNLVGLQHIQRFIPLANPDVQVLLKPAAAEPPSPPTRSAARGDETTREMPRLKVAASKPAAPSPDASASRPQRADDSTREMPRLKVSSSAPASTKANIPASKTKADGKKSSHPPSHKSSGPVPVALTPGMQTKIVADAIRLLKWGKEWHELADLIARIAERPPIGDIRKVLRNQKAEIESKAAKGR